MSKKLDMVVPATVNTHWSGGSPFGVYVTVSRAISKLFPHGLGWYAVGESDGNLIIQVSPSTDKITDSRHSKVQWKGFVRGLDMKGNFRMYIGKKILNRFQRKALVGSAKTQEVPGRLYSIIVNGKTHILLELPLKRIARRG